MHASLPSDNLHANGRNPLSLQSRLHQPRSSSSFLIGWLSRQANASLAQHQTAVDGRQGHAQASQTKTARAASRLSLRRRSDRWCPFGDHPLCRPPLCGALRPSSLPHLPHRSTAHCTSPRRCAACSHWRLRVACCELRVACPQTGFPHRNADRLSLPSDPPPPFLPSFPTPTISSRPPRHRRIAAVTPSSHHGGPHSQASGTGWCHPGLVSRSLFPLPQTKLHSSKAKILSTIKGVNAFSIRWRFQAANFLLLRIYPSQDTL